MSDNVVQFPGITILPIEPDKVLDGAKAANLEYVLVIGKNENGEEYFASSDADVSIAFYWIELFKHRTFTGKLGGDGDR